jgi:hypothetical protein
MFSHPGNDLLEVDQMIRKGRGWPQPVVGAEAHPTLARETVEQRTGLPAFPPAEETAPVQIHQRRPSRRLETWSIEIEEVPPACVAVTDVRQPLDIAAPDEDRQEQNAKPRKPTAQPRGNFWIEVATPTRPQTFAQGTLNCSARTPSPPRDDSQASRGQDGQTEHHPAARRVDITLAKGQQGSGENPVEGYKTAAR